MAPSLRALPVLVFVLAFFAGGVGSQLTDTQTLTPSGSLSASQSQSSSESLTLTASQSITASVSQSPSASRTSTQNSSASNSASTSETGSVTTTPTQSETASNTQSSSQDRSASTTPSPSQSRSLSQTPTTSPSQAQTLSGTLSASLTQSPSPTRSASATATGSSTATSTLSTTPTETQSPSPTPTPSTTQTQSSSQDRSASTTPSPSQSRSPSQTSTPSTTQTASMSQTLSASQTQTASSTQSPSQDRTASSTPSGSVSLTPSTTQTQSPSSTLTPSSSWSASQTVTPSTTKTASVTQSSSASFTATGSQTITPSSSSTPSLTHTPSVTQSQTRSMTQTPSATQTASSSSTSSVTQSQSPSVSQSASQTLTASSTLTPSASQSPSQTHTQSPSGARTRSQTETGSATLTPSLTATPSETLSPSQSESATVSITPSHTATASVTQTPSTSESPSATSTPSHSGTCSQTQSTSHTQSASQTQSQSPSVTMTQSPSMSQTPSQTQTVTQSRSAPPFRMAFQVLDSEVLPARDTAPPPTLASGPSFSTPVPVSDSLPALLVTPWISRCPEPALLAAGLGIECAVSRDDGEPPSTTVSWRPRVVDLSECPAARGAINVPVIVIVAPAFGVASGAASLTCTLVAGSSVFVTATMPIALQGTNWPLAADSISLAAGREDVMTSSVFGPADSGVVRAALQFCGAVPTNADARYGNCALTAAQAVWGSTTPPDLLTPVPPLAPPPFVLNVTSTTLLIFRAGLDGAFSAYTSVTVAGVACMLAAVSGDGRWAAVFTPNATTMCGPDGTSAGRCGYGVLVASTPGTVAGAPRGATLSCPPFCAGDLVRARGYSAGGAPVVPFAIDAGGTVFAPAVQATAAAGNVSAAVLALSFMPPSLGVFYSSSCTDAGYTDPATGACTNASDPASFTCAYGAGKACSQCPENSLCPGGSRIWPRAGFFAFSETDAYVQLCSEAGDAAARCVGWDPIAGATICGAGYRQGSFLCDACAESYYPVGDGSCAACPRNQSTFEVYRGLLSVLAAVFAVVLLVYALLVVLVRQVGGTLRSTSGHAGQLLAWTITTLQGVAQVAAVTSSSLPSLLTRMFNSVAVLNFRGLVLPPQCSGAFPFETEMAVMSGLVAAVMITVLLVIASRLTCCSMHARGLLLAGRLSLTAALIALAPAVTDATALLYCVPTVLSSAAVAVLDGGSTAAASIGPTGTGSVSLLASNPFFVCWAPEGAHIRAAPFAAVTLVIAAGIGPVLLYLLVQQDPWLRVKLAESQSFAAQVLRCTRCGSRGDADDELLALGVNVPEPTLLAPILIDFKPSAWYTKFLDIILTLLLAALQATLPRPTTPGFIAVKATVICIATVGLTLHLVIVRPYIIRRYWMGRVRSVLLILASCCASMNAVAAAIDNGALSRGPKLDAGLTAASAVMLILVFIAAVILVRGIGTDMIAIASAEQEAAQALRRRWSGLVQQTPVTSPRSRRLFSMSARIRSRKSLWMSQAPSMHDNPLLSGELADRFQLHKADQLTAPHPWVGAILSTENPLRCVEASPVVGRTRQEVFADSVSVVRAVPSAALRSRMWKAFGPGGALSPSIPPMPTSRPGLSLRSATRRGLRSAAETTSGRASQRKSRSSSTALPKTSELGDTSRPDGISGIDVIPPDVFLAPWRLNPLSRMRALRVLDPLTASYHPWSQNPLRWTFNVFDPATASFYAWTLNPLRQRRSTEHDPATALLNSWTRNPLRQLLAVCPPAVFPAQSTPEQAGPVECPLDAIPSNSSEQTCSLPDEAVLDLQPEQSASLPTTMTTVDGLTAAPRGLGMPIRQHDAPPSHLLTWALNPLRSMKPTQAALSEALHSVGIRRSDPLPAPFFHGWKLNPMPRKQQPDPEQHNCRRDVL